MCVCPSQNSEDRPKAVTLAFAGRRPTYMLSIYNRRNVVCMWFRHKILRIGPKDLCGAPVPAEGWHLGMCQP